ncbi:DNA polymerase Y family protein [Maritimibacter sp. DP1N21-5]|uniref:Y-family DNA polymerase n=1 Tax=Maritimibacter sp. DP1N21-5 TaxID=2836867 RepID=UPI001C45A3C8|nr:DNA polymerase Y family protein [Maritimibacter sp. DP1N21-5]MBV7407569.1 DNA polymerase Y family protein [Maritimibacter sp. DP1N21-5]
MPPKRHLSLWFPRLAAERLIRLERGLPPGPFVVVEDQRGAQVISSLNLEASQAGLTPGQPLRDARAMCAGLVARPANRVAEAGFLTTLRRWSGKFTPWVAEAPPDGLILDITGCAHLFGGEEPLARAVDEDCAALGLTVRLGIADSLGAAWALARFSGSAAGGYRNSDAIDQEARATRSRAAKRRHWTRGGEVPGLRVERPIAPRIAAVGQTRQAIGPLPVAALRLDPETVAGLNRLGLRRIEDLIGTPRAGLARRFGRHMVQRLDQALGVEPEPVSPARPPQVFAVRMRMPDPIGLLDDISAALDRLLPELGERLARAGRGARRIRAEFFRADHTMDWIDVGLARPSADPDRIRPLLALRLSDLDAGFGIDQVRVIATVHEAIHLREHAGHANAGAAVSSRGATARLDDLLGRIGARLGLDAMTRLHPAESHIPEKTALVLSAAFSEPATHWAPPPRDRPLRLWPSEPITPVAPETGQVAGVVPERWPERRPERRPERERALPACFRWRGRVHRVLAGRGPERILPEWWLDSPEWRSGPRDYWIVTTERGERLWLYYAHGGEMSAGWFCQGDFG